MAIQEDRSFSSHSFLLLLVAFLGIFLYGLLAALPGAVLPTLERNQYLPTDTQVGTFLFINAVGAVLAYLISGPLIDKVGKKLTLIAGTVVVIASMVGLALTVTNVAAAEALLLIFACSLLLGLGANAIVSAGHALVADVAASWRNAALNLLDVFFGLGLMTLPLFVQALQKRGGLGFVFWVLAVAALILVAIMVVLKFPAPAHPESFPIGEAKDLLKNPSFWLLAIALFMYVGAEVSVGKWVVSFMERDASLLAHSGPLNTQLPVVSHASPAALSRFFEQDPTGIAIATYALRTLSFFAAALLAGRIVSSLLLGVLKVNSLRLLVIGSAITALGLGLGFTATSPDTVRWALVLAGFGMGPIFPTSVGLASVIVPRIAGTAMSLAMGIGFAGLLLIPPAVGYVSVWVGGEAGNVRTGLLVVLSASIIMLLLHVVLSLRERRSS
ncbi:MAG TPA: MFS transporter [Pyrinomonadaceae bacterium]|nr:MFS transporter [Pyrinomonadaceae bacterium]